MARLRNFIDRFRQHRLLHTHQAAIAVIVVVVLVMMYPLPLYIWRPSLAGGRDIDLWMKLWDNWWFKQILFHGEPMFRSTFLFYPTGADMRFHSIAWLRTAFWVPLEPVFGPYGAHNLLILTSFIIAGITCYFLVFHLSESRLAGTLAGAIYAIHPIHTSGGGSVPDVSTLDLIPFTVLMVILLFERKQIRYAILASIGVMLTAWTSLYILDFTALTVVFVVVFLFIHARGWRDRKLVTLLVVFAGLSILLLLPRTLPIVLGTDGSLGQAIEKRDIESSQVDLLGYLSPSRYHGLLYRLEIPAVAVNPIHRKSSFYLGLAALFLLIRGLWRRDGYGVQYRGLWLAMLGTFLILSLGTILRVNGHDYPQIWMPARLIYWLPFIRVLTPSLFALIILLPFAILVGSSASQLTRTLNARPILQLIVLGGLSGLMLFEMWNGRFPLQDTTVHPFFHDLAEKDGADFAIIHVPFGRQNSKPYMFYQTIHGEPIANGAPGRDVSSNFAFIENNPMLANLEADISLDCSINYAGSIEALEQAGFRYVVVMPYYGGEDVPGVSASFFETTMPLIDEADFKVYRVADWAESPSPCLDP